MEGGGAVLQLVNLTGRNGRLSSLAAQQGYKSSAFSPNPLGFPLGISLPGWLHTAISPLKLLRKRKVKHFLKGGGNHLPAVWLVLVDHDIILVLRRVVFIPELAETVLASNKESFKCAKLVPLCGLNVVLASV